MQVLLIESDPVLAKSIAAYMFTKQVDILVSADAQDAILACDTKRPDVIVLDMALTGHSGIEFLHEFRSYHDWQHIPVLLWSMQYVTTQQKHALQQLGVSAVLYKPKTTLQQLCSQLQSYAPALV